MNQSHAIQSPGEPSARTLSLMLFLGFLLLTANILIWLGGWALIGKPYGHTWQIFLYAVFLGRAAAVGVGREMGFASLFLFFQTAAADLIIVFLVYPVFVKGYQHLTRVRYIGNTLDSMHKVALSYKPVIAPYGFVGLMLFVIFPFWSTGALVGAILGYIIGMPALATLVSINLGNVISIGAWVWFYDLVRDWNRGVALALLALILAIAIAGIVVGMRSRMKTSVETTSNAERTDFEEDRHGNSSEPGTEETADCATCARESLEKDFKGGV